MIRCVFLFVILWPGFDDLFECPRVPENSIIFILKGRFYFVPSPLICMICQICHFRCINILIQLAKSLDILSINALVYYILLYAQVHTCDFHVNLSIIVILILFPFIPGVYSHFFPGPKLRLIVRNGIITFFHCAFFEIKVNRRTATKITYILHR